MCVFRRSGMVLWIADFFNLAGTWCLRVFSESQMSAFAEWGRVAIRVHQGDFHQSIRVDVSLPQGERGISFPFYKQLC